LTSWIFDVVDSGFEDDLSELTVPEACTHGIAERALDVGEGGLSHPALVVIIIVHTCVMSSVEMSEFTMFE
jgi:hypothetical protein